MSFLALLVHIVGMLCADAFAEEATAILKVKATVDGAEVWVDGAVLGKTPLTKYLPPGSHQLRVVADRYDPFVRRIDLVADRTLESNATLTPGKGTLEFSGGAPGAHVFLDGADRGPVPIRLPAPSPGKHAWRVEAPKFGPLEGEVAHAVISSGITTVGRGRRRPRGIHGCLRVPAASPARPR